MRSILHLIQELDPKEGGLIDRLGIGALAQPIARGLVALASRAPGPILGPSVVRLDALARVVAHRQLELRLGLRGRQRERRALSPPLPRPRAFFRPLSPRSRQNQDD